MKLDNLGYTMSENDVSLIALTILDVREDEAQYEGKMMRVRSARDMYLRRRLFQDALINGEAIKGVVVEYTKTELLHLDTDRRRHWRLAGNKIVGKDRRVVYQHVQPTDDDKFCNIGYVVCEPLMNGERVVAIIRTI